MFNQQTAVFRFQREADCSFEKPFLHGVEIFPFLRGDEAAIDPLYERKPEFYLWRGLGIRLWQENYWPWKVLEEAYDWCLEPLGMTFKEFMAGTAHDSPPLPMKKFEVNGFGTPTGKYTLYCTTLKELGGCFQLIAPLFTLNSVDPKPAHC